MFSSSSRSLMGSNCATVQTQGGGDKKAGFPYQVGRGWHTSIAFQQNPGTGKCCNLGQMQISLFPNATVPRNIGSRYSTYYHIPGTGNH